MTKFWLFSFNFLYYASSAFFNPFLVLYYQSLHFSGLEIGVLTGFSPLIYLISAPIVTNLADRMGWHRQILLISMALVALGIALYPFANTFILMAALAFSITIIMGPVIPFVESATMYMLGDEKKMYGRVRLGGTLGWAIAAIVAGMVLQNYGLSATFWGSALLMGGAFLLAWKLIFPNSSKSKRGEGSVTALLRDPLWLRFLALAFLGGVSIAISSNYFFLYMSDIGTPESLMGIALSMGTVVEIPTLFFGNRLLERFKPYHLLIVAMLLNGLRLLLFGLINNYWLVMLIQPLGGLAFVVAWMAGVAYANENAPENLSATAQGLFTAMLYGFGSAVGGLLGGLLLERMNVQSIYMVIGIGIFVAVLAIVMFFRLLPDLKPKHSV